MKKITIFCLLISFLCCSFAQQEETVTSYLYPFDNILTPSDEMLLQACPVLKLDAFQLARPLPAAVDNSRTPFMTPIYSQSALECGQAASIAYTFSYETNCRRGTENNNYMRRYPTHFAWNFCNGGSSCGVSFLDTWEVIRTAGTPNVAEWGGWYDTGGPARWASGYSLYHSAMENRISEFLAIPVDSEEGLLTLKHWLDNHLCGDEHGGLANFYSTHVPNGNEEMLRQIPEGTPHAGEWIVPALKSNVNHGQTIVGYNDSICWDYNGDGLYTNDRDLNGDGVVNLRDWEVGAVIFCNSFGTGFANSGYCYLPYRKLAELPDGGGIWNKTVYVVNVKDPVSPRLTYKATLTHSSRNKIKLQAGVAADLTATQPEHTIDWGVFNFQGGDHYMQGGESEDQKTLELGLDVSRLLDFIEPGSSAKFFLQVIENDPNNEADGQIESFTVMDYAGSLMPVQTACAQMPMAIANNATTTASVVAAIDFSRPEMQPALPNMEAFTPYSFQIPAAGGTPPYRFEFTKEYKIEEFNAALPTVSGNTVNLSNNNSGYALVDIPFDFPFYDNSFNQLCIFADGYITFRYDTYNWPFLQNEEQQTRATQMIAPFRTDLTVSSIKIKKNSSEVSLLVQAKISDQSSSNIQYVVKLYPNGEIEFYYGSMSYNGNGGFSLISRGDTRIWQTTPVSGVPAAQVANRCFRFSPPHKVDFLTLSRTGILSGKSDEQFVAMPVSITCFDANDLRCDTVAQISCEYGDMLTITDLQISAGNDNIINAGEEVTLSFKVHNLDSLPFNNCNITFSCASPYVEMLDDQEYFGYISGGNVYALNNAIRFRVAEDTPNKMVLDFIAAITNDRYPMTSLQSMTVYSDWLEIENFAIVDSNNQRVEVDETDHLNVWFKNMGNNDIEDLQFTLGFQQTDITLMDIHDDCYLLPAGETYHAEFIFHPQPGCALPDVLDAYIDIFIGDHYTETKVIPLIISANCEDFENGIPLNFTMADTAWTTSATALDGTTSMSSGNISHNDTSTMTCQFTALREGEISFFYKTSTENNYDWLYFFIDGVQQERWSGIHDWTAVSFPVQQGEHTLAWKYIKDYSVDGNDDKVWIDNLCLPLENEATPELQITPGAITVSVNAEPIVIPLQYESVTPIFLIFENQLVDSDGNPLGWASIQYHNGSLSALESRQLELTLNLAGLPDGVYRANLVASVEGGNEVTVPIEVTATGTGIEELDTDETSVRVFPNPTADRVTVQIEGPALPETADCRLYDETGKLLRQFHLTENQFVVNLSPYTSGLYFLQISTGQSYSKVVKILKK